MARLRAGLDLFGPVFVFCCLLCLLRTALFQTYLCQLCFPARSPDASDSLWPGPARSWTPHGFRARRPSRPRAAPQLPSPSCLIFERSNKEGELGSGAHWGKPMRRGKAARQGKAMCRKTLASGAYGISAPKDFVPRGAETVGARTSRDRAEKPISTQFVDEPKKNTPDQ